MSFGKTKSIQSLPVICSVLFQKMHLLKLNVPAQFMMVALDEGPGPPIKYQYAELSKLYSVVSQLVRCCDVSSKCASSVVSISMQNSVNFTL